MGTSLPEQIVLPFNNPLTTQLDLGGNWHLGIFFGCTLIVGKWIYDRKFLHISEKLLLSYVLIYALYIAEFPKAHFGVYTTAFQLTAAQTFLECFLVVLGAKMLHKHFFAIVPYLVSLELIAIWIGQDGLLVAPSFNSAFCALALPFLPLWCILITLITLVTHHGSTALLIVASQLWVYALKKKWVKWFLLIPPLFAGIAYLHHNLSWFDADERITKYVQFMKFWAQDWKWILFGVGPGSFTWISLIRDEFKGNLFLSMHSDWLQILWELGILGLILSLNSLGFLIKRIWNHPQLLSAVFGCVTFGLTYHPLRWFPSSFLMACIWIQCSQKRPGS